MGRWLANLFWAVRRSWQGGRPSERQRLSQRIDGLAARILEIEAEQRLMWKQGWRAPPARVTPLRPVVDDN